MDAEKAMQEQQMEDSPQRRQTITQDFIPSPGPSASKSTFPVSRVKAIMRQDQDVQMVSGDAVYAMAVATEAFLEILAKEAYTFTKAESRKTVQYKDLAKAVESVVAFEFLEGALRGSTFL
jgi:DNA polymerase epsilon subunit 4